MSPGALLGMNIYQEGQRAFRVSTPNPYPFSDWRSATWMKGWRAAQAYAQEEIHAAIGTPSMAPLNVPGKFALTVEHDGQGSLFVMQVSDLHTPEGCEQLLRLIMLACKIDPDTLHA